MRAWPIVERGLLIAVMAVVVVLVLCLVAWHLKWNALQRDIAAVKPRAEVPLTPLPVNDAAVWADFLAWGGRAQQSMLINDHAGFGHDRLAMVALLDGDAVAPPARVAASRAELDRQLAELDALIGRGLHPTVFPPGTDERLDRNAQDQVGMAGGAWAWCARVDGDPAAAVAAQERIIAAFAVANARSVGTDQAVRTYLDRTCVAAALDGHLSPALWARWRDEPDGIALVLPEIERERIEDAARIFRSDFADNPVGRAWEVRASGVGFMRRAVEDWWRRPEGFATYVASLDRVESAILAGEGDAGFLTSSMETAMMHRYGVLAAQIIALRRADGVLPAAPAIALAGTNDTFGGPEAVGLRYRKIDAQRFRITVDPAAPVPRAWKALTTKGFTAGAVLIAPTASMAPTKRVLAWGMGGIEVDCGGGTGGTVGDGGGAP